MDENQKGFTIIELVVVIAIIAILAAIIIAGMSNIMKKLRLARIKEDFSNFQKASDLFVGKYGVYPNQANNLYPGGTIPQITDGSGTHYLTEFWNLDWTTYNAKYYKPNAFYWLSFEDGNSDGKIGCGGIYLYYGDLPSGFLTPVAYKITLCQDCPANCGESDYSGVN